MKKTKKQIKFEEIQKDGLAQIEMFIQMCKFARTSASFGGFGITYEDLENKGMTTKVFNWLVANHYVNKPQKGRPLWIANTNKLYPNQTIDNLEKKVKEYKAEQENKND